jgi:hypothetical protein
MGIKNRVRTSVALAALVAAMGSCSGGGGGDSGGGSTNTGPTGPSTPTTPTTPAVVPLTITITSVVSQGAAAGVILGLPPAVKVTNSSGTPMPGIVVTWSVAPSNGTVSSPTSTTDANGAATTNWSLSPVIAQQHVVASVPNGTATVSFTGTVLVTSVAFSAPNATAFVGDSITLTAVAKDTRGTTMTDAVPLSVKSTTIAATATNGRIAALKNGATYVIGSVTGPAGILKDSVLLDVYTKLHGTVHTYDGSVMPAMRAYSTNGALTDSVNVNADGTYSLGVHSHFTTGFNTEILIDAVDKSNRKFFPSLTPISITCKSDQECIGSYLDSAQNVILLPRQYTVTRGRFAGQTLTVDLDAGNDEATTVQPSFLFASGLDNTTYPVNGVPTDRKQFSNSEYFWMADSFPINVAMHRSQSNQPFTNAAADSVFLWTALNEIQTALGYNIWVPVNDNPAWSIPYTGFADPRVPNKTYLIVLNDTLAPAAIAGGGGTAPLLDNLGLRSPSILGVVDFHVTGWRGTKVDHWSDAVEMPQEQSVFIRYESLMSNPALLTHESMHTMAVGHGCHWVSTQSYCGQFAAQDGKLRFEDAAYTLLMMDIYKAAWKYRAPLAMPSALFGSRAIMQGLPPIPEDWTIADPNTGGSTVQGDILQARRPLIKPRP